jgi:biotin carboxylase
VSSDRLIISCDYGSQPVFALKEASANLCEIIWLVDLGVPEMEQMARLMARMGTVINLAGLSVEQTIDALGEKKPTGLLCLNDRAMVPLAGIAAGLGLQFHSPVVAGYLSDKLLQRQALQAAGIPTPEFRPVSAAMHQSDIDRVADEVGFPAVLKPRQGSGSRNTFMVQDRTELTHLLAVPGTRQREQAGMILEAYLPRADRTVSRFDSVVSVESFIDSREIRHFAITGRLPFADPFRETGLVLPSDLSSEDADAAVETTAAALRALDVVHGCLHTELKFTPDGPRIIEVNGRVGGGVPQLVALAGGDVSILTLAMELALGMSPSCELPLAYSGIGWQRTVPPPVSARRVNAIAGLDRLTQVPGIDQITLNRNAGEAVDWRRGLPEYVYQVYGSSSDYEEVEAQQASIDEIVTVIYDDRTTDRARTNLVETPCGSDP